MQKPPFARTIGVYGIFAASGASALIYQIIWTRWLGLVFGNTTASISIVLGCFMTGLALGSWAAGRLMRRIAKPMRTYAAMELGIGIFALLSPLVFRLADAVFTVLIRPDSPPVLSLSARAALSFIILAVPTTLMGTTLPLLTEFFRRNPRHTESWKVGILYAVNTLGAAFGILAATFVLIEWVGVSATTAIAASLNFAVAALGYAFSRLGGEAAPAKDQAADGDGAGRRVDGWRLAVAVLTASGAVALASEVLWTRTLGTLVGNSAYAFGTIVLLYLVGIAAGSWLMALLVRRLRRLSLWLVGLQLAMGIWVLVSIALFKEMAIGIAEYKAQMVPILLIFWNYLKAMGILTPLAVFSGACFPLATRMIEPASEDPQGRSIAEVYSWNTAGAVAGSIIAGFLIAPHFEFFDSLYVIASLYGLTALAAMIAIAWADRGVPRSLAIATPAAAVALTVIMFGMSGATGESYFLRHLRTKAPWAVILFHKAGLQGVTTAFKTPFIPRSDGLLINGVGMTAKVTDTKMMAHLPMMFHPDPKDTLVICFGMGTTFRSAMSYGGNVTTVELVKEVFDAFGCFYDDSEQVRANPKGRMIVNDGRNFLKLTREKFDVITIDPPPPIDAAGVVHLYSKDFIELAKSRLKKGGIMAHWYPYAGSKSGIDDPETYNSLVKTFVTTFPYVYWKSGYSHVGLHLIGTMEPLSIDRDTIEKRLAAGRNAADLREWDPVPSKFFLELLRVTEPMTEWSILTDDKPFLEFYLIRTLRSGEKKMFPASEW